MYHGNAQHSGGVADSDLDLRSLASIEALPPVSLPNGTALGVPALVDGSAYLGTCSFTSNETVAFYRINLASGAIEAQHDVAAPPSPRNKNGQPAPWPWGTGCASTPAVVDGRVYGTLLEGQVLCLDATTLMPVWSTNLVHLDPAHAQYVEQGFVLASIWTSPLIVKNRVYVACGRGDPDTTHDEDAGYCFIYCLDAATGNVLWLYCTNQESPGDPNLPNQIPPSLRVGGIQPPFTYMAGDPRTKGADCWSSLAYDALVNRVFVGTGNPDPDAPLPTPGYSNGVLSLDADTGEFAGFFPPAPTDSYRPTDTDVDMAGSPTLYNLPGGPRVLAIGGKTGSVFVLRVEDLGVVARRQTLPYQNGNEPLPAIANGGGDYGIFSAPAVDFDNGRLFVGLGSPGGFDWTSTPFVRALDWSTLADAWPTRVLGGIVKYDTEASPFYTSKSRSAVSSPLVANGVVLVTTRLPAIYGFDAATGACVWQDEENVGGAMLGPAVSGNFVVVAGAKSLFRWRVPARTPTPAPLAEMAAVDLLLRSS
jgi:outer membrane protein assembly factor BamB